MNNNSIVTSHGIAYAQGPAGAAPVLDIGQFISPLLLLLTVIFLIRYIKRRLTTQKERKVRAQHKSTEASGVSSFKFIDDELQAEEEVVIAVEYMPLDNRFGSSTVVSEHEFTRTEKTNLILNETRELQGSIKGEFWSVIQANVQNTLAETLGVEIDSEISRRVSIKLEAPPGKLVRYRISWRQTKRTGKVTLVINSVNF